MKKLLLILLCLPIIGFGQNNRILKGTLIKVSNSDVITSKNISIGDIKNFIVYEDVFSSSGDLLIKKDTELTGKVTSGKKAKTFGRRGDISIEINYLNDINGEPIRVSCKLAKEGKGRFILWACIGWIPPWFIQALLIKGTNAKINKGEVFLVEVQDSHEVNLQSEK